MKKVHFFDGEEHRLIDDPAVIRELRRKPHLDIPPIPKGGVHNDFTAWLAIERAKDAVAKVERAFGAANY